MNIPLRFGIAGAGFIASTVANAIEKSDRGTLTSIASRRPETALGFAQEHNIPNVYDTWQEMLASKQVDAVYVATPTSVREEISVAAAAAQKHVLAEKPFASLESLRRIADACHAHGVALMDATHFSHHPRTEALKAQLTGHIGEPIAVNSSFFFPLMDRGNIRFDPTKEPTGAVGDMGWYSMRALVEYTPSNLAISSLAGSTERDPVTGAVIRASGAMSFENGLTSTWNFGYTAGALLMDLDLLGRDGAVQLNDFVLDWALGSDFSEPEHSVGFLRRRALDPPSRFEFVETRSDRPQIVRMIDTFARLTHAPEAPEAGAHKRASFETQRLVDALWSTLD